MKDRSLLAIPILLTLAALLSSPALARPLPPSAGAARPLNDSISPTLGSEILTDGALENWLSTTNLTSWTETLLGTSTVNREATTIHGGTYSTRLDIDASGNNATISETHNQVTGSWLLVDFWGRSSGSGKQLKIGYDATTGPNLDPGTNWTHYFNVLRIESADTRIYFQRGSGSASGSIYYDDLSLKKETLSSLFGGTTTASTVNITAAANWTITKGTQGGVVAALNSTSNPTYFVIAYHDGTNFHLDKCINGVYTSLINTAVTYSAGAEIKIVRQDNTYQAYYNGAQVSTDQDITNGFLGNIYGAFSTYSGNSYTGLTFTDSSTPTPSNTPTNTATATFTPTDTATPTLTHTPGPTPTITQTPTITVTPFPIPTMHWDGRVSYGQFAIEATLLCLGILILLFFGSWLIFVGLDKWRKK